MNRINTLWMTVMLLATGTQSFAACPWAPVEFEPGTTKMTKSTLKAIDSVIERSTDKIGRIRIYGVFSQAKLRTPATSEYFNVAASNLTAYLEAFLEKNPGWKVTAEQIKSSSEEPAKHDIEIEFHGYDDPDTHPPLDLASENEWRISSRLFLTYDASSNKLTAAARAQIDAALKQNRASQLYVRLIALSANQDGTEQTLELSNERLDNVVSYLISKGFLKGQILMAQASEANGAGKNGVEVTFVLKAASSSSSQGK